ncbi:MAG TPA: hypothetical protein VFX23_05740 [Limnobacter sp.]|uniref:hypothetical protein n=1 Tax=Limnobacter sp. TaxID=2003368 RepID=UPI002E34A04B|nr:hypothetical protein [Limnobacter sp.]HEX5485478.1 hypothetical protein [Limnobacter sp.]
MAKSSEKSGGVSPAGDSGEFSSLASESGVRWLQWFSQAASGMPEFQRALKFLDSVYALLNVNVDQRDGVVLARKLGQLMVRFTGQGRCPSAQACDKLASRILVLNGWLHAIEQDPERAYAWQSALVAGTHALDKLFTTSEGADDRHGVLVRALREFSKHWLKSVESASFSGSDRANLVFKVALNDRSGLVPQDWWWRSLADTDRQTLLLLIDQEIAQLPQTQPSLAVSWKSYDQRWRRLRLKGLLEHLHETSLLADLLKKSAVDDFEAVSAIQALRAAGRHRDAIYQAEQWHRMMPRSAVLAEALYALYVEDGWDDEACELALAQFEMDPNPLWIDLLRKQGSSKADLLVKDLCQRVHLN